MLDFIFQMPRKLEIGFSKSGDIAKIIKEILITNEKTHRKAIQLKEQHEIKASTVEKALKLKADGYTEDEIKAKLLMYSE